MSKSLLDPVDDVKWNAALSLAMLGDTSGLDVLEMMMDREYLDLHNEMDDEMKSETLKLAVLAVGDLGVMRYREYIEKLSKTDPSMKVRQAAMDALSKIENNG